MFGNRRFSILPGLVPSVKPGPAWRSAYVAWQPVPRGLAPRFAPSSFFYSTAEGWLVYSGWGNISLPLGFVPPPAAYAAEMGSCQDRFGPGPVAGPAPERRARGNLRRTGLLWTGKAPS